MNKEQVISDAKASFASGQDQVLTEVLGSVYDQALAEGGGTVSGPSEEEIQGRIDAAVSEALAADEIVDQAKIDELNAMISGLHAEMAAKQVEHDALVLKEGVEAAQLESIKASKAQLQGVVDYFASLLAPAPVEPAPEVPVQE